MLDRYTYLFKNTNKRIDEYKKIVKQAQLMHQIQSQKTINFQEEKSKRHECQSISKS